MKKNYLLDWLKTIVIVILATAVGFILYYFKLSQSNIIMVYIIGALLVGAVTSSRWYGVGAALACVLLFNFIFTEPRFQFRANEIGIILTSVTTFMSIVLVSSYTVEIKDRERRFRRDAYRSNLILDTNRLLRSANNPTEILETTASQLNKLFKRNIVCYSAWNQTLEGPKHFMEHTSHSLAHPSGLNIEKERMAADTCMRSGHSAGASTKVSSDCFYRYSPVKSADTVYGVLGICLDHSPLDDFENSLYLTLISQCAMAMEKEFISRKRQEEAALAREEQLRANLLRSISHDLRTPLTSISGNAGVLLADTGGLDEDRRKAICQDIYDDSMWLINLVENLLSITRVEGGRVQLSMETELLEEVVDEALRHVNRHKKHHHIQASQEGDYILVPMDARLMIQVITNLVDNAIKYTPDDSTIEIYSRQEGSLAIIEVRDNGPGIPDEAKERVFDMFYTTGSRSGDGKRGLGLGLALCKSITAAHKGSIEVLDNVPTGSIFRITLPAEEVPLHE